MALRGPGILTGGKAPLNQTRASDLCPLRWQRKDTMRRPTRPSALQVSAIHGGGGGGNPYLRGLSLNRVLWLPITELPPLLLLPSSSPWE